VRVAVGLYLAGIAIAMWRTDASWATRTAVALMWPLGPFAFIVTVLILIAASTIAFPVVGAVVVAGALLGWWVLIAT
jgi:hypothetical protein